MPRPLPAEFVQLLQSRLAATAVKPLSVASSTRRAAVFVPICADDAGVPSILFTQRSSKVGTHKGQVSFPGGHIDPQETPEAAAAREFAEEVALPAPWQTDPPAPLLAPTSASSVPVEEHASPLGVLGRWHDAIAITGTHVTPVLGFLHGDAAVCQREPPASPNEVDSVFALTLPQLADAEHYEVEDRSVPYRAAGVTLQHRPYLLPVFKAGPQRVWGLTAYILDGLLRQLLLPAWNDAFPSSKLRLPPYALTGGGDAAEGR